ncbi:hypothetical protein [Kibdelosporangium phytohabitans]|uniref:hypothetical protein n=1 Tax=Kibdelosporangium phytohabitans TaxID=860235 RepID=UPI0012F7DA40|nr:hypothetical protein [Kibdelosporangium phytohabitans]
MLVRDDPTETGHAAPRRPVRDAVVAVRDVVLLVAMAFVTRLLAAATVGAGVSTLLAFAQLAGGDRAAAVVMVVVGYLAVCVQVIRMGLLEMRRLEKASRRRRSP